MFKGWNQYAVLMKMKINERWKFRRMNGERKRLTIKIFIVMKEQKVTKAMHIN